LETNNSCFIEIGDELDLNLVHTTNDEDNGDNVVDRGMRTKS